MNYLLAHDVGNRAQGSVGGCPDRLRHCIAPYPIHYPRSDWAEQELKTGARESSPPAPGDGAAGAAPGESRIAIHQLLGIVPMGPTAIPPSGESFGWTAALRAAVRLMRKFPGQRVFAIVAGTPMSGKMTAQTAVAQGEEPMLSADGLLLDVNGTSPTGPPRRSWSGRAPRIGFDLKEEGLDAGDHTLHRLDQGKFPELSARSIQSVV